MAATARSETAMKAEARRLLLADGGGDALDKLRLQCLARGCGGIKSLARIFRVVDDSGDRRLDYAEFSKGCRDYGAALSGDELTAVFQAFDSDNSGSIDFEEFLVGLRPAMSAARQRIVMEAYRKLDANGDGVIRVDDIERRYSVDRHPKFLSGEASKPQLFAQFLKTFECGSRHVDGTVTKEEFLNYYAGVSASIDNDVYFDLMMRNAWKL